VIFVLMCLAGLAALVAITNTSIQGQGYWMPIGRYEEVIVPAAVLLGVRLLTLGPPDDRYETRCLISITVVLAVVSVWATPLYVVEPKSFVDNPALALAIYIVEKGGFVWRARYDPSVLERVGFAVPFVFLGMAWIFAARWRRAIIVPIGLVLS